MQKSNLLKTPHVFCNAADSKELQNPILLNQIHSFKVITISEKPSKIPSADAYVTDVAGLRLTIKTADCAPVLFYDEKNQVVGAAHAGWKGALNGILEQTVLAMLKKGAEISNIVACIGPCIHQKSNHFSDDVIQLFPSDTHIFFKEGYFDLVGFIKYRLEFIGIKSVDVIDIDTFADLNYNSYRRDPANPDRQYSAIWLEDKNG